MKFDVVIVGGGFAGAYAARALVKAWGKDVARRPGGVDRGALDADGCWKGRAHATQSSALVVFRQLALKLLREDLDLKPRARP